MVAVRVAGLAAGANPVPTKSLRDSTKLPPVQTKQRTFPSLCPQEPLVELNILTTTRKGKFQGFLSVSLGPQTDGKTDREKWLCPRGLQCCGAGGPQRSPWLAELRTGVQAAQSPWPPRHISVQTQFRGSFTFLPGVSEERRGVCTPLRKPALRTKWMEPKQGVAAGTACTARWAAHREHKAESGFNFICEIWLGFKLAEE